jgi:hypothetical protein
MTLQKILTGAVRKAFSLAFIAAAAAFTFDTVSLVCNFNQSAAKSRQHIPYEMAAMVAFGGGRIVFRKW